MSPRTADRRGNAILYPVEPPCHCDADHRELLSLGSTLSAILEPRAALIVLGASRGESAELEVALVKDAVTANPCLVARA